VGVPTRARCPWEEAEHSVKLRARLHTFATPPPRFVALLSQAQWVLSRVQSPCRLVRSYELVALSVRLRWFETVRRLPTVSGHPDNLQAMLPSGVLSPEIVEDAYAIRTLGHLESRRVGVRDRHDQMKGKWVRWVHATAVAGRCLRDSETAHAQYWIFFWPSPVIPLLDNKVSWNG